MLLRKQNLMIILILVGMYRLFPQEKLNENSYLKTIEEIPGLIAYYPFNNNANDESGNGHNGQINGSVPFVQGKYGNGVSFNGSGANFIRIPHNSQLNFVGSFSICAWISTTDTTTPAHVISKGRDINSAYAIAGGGKAIYFNNSYNNGGGVRYYGSFPYNEWHFVVGVINVQAGKVEYYYDGVKSAESNLGSVQPNITTDYPLILGRHFTYINGGSDYPYPFKGKLDEARLYNRALTQSEVSRLYLNQSITITSPNGGESWAVGATQLIKWQSNLQLPLNIQYSTSSGANWIDVATDVPDTGSFLWMVPNTPSENCRVHIYSPIMAEINNDMSDDDFKIIIVNEVPIVSNVDFTMRNDGSKIVEIIYDVYDANEQPLTITVASSSDGGISWDLPITQISGDIGSGITNGNGKTIVWDAAADLPNFSSPTVQIRISADDGIEFICGTDKIKHEGKIYNTIEIGSQCWLKENLDVGTMIQGSQNQSNNSVIEKYCYNNSAANCNTYGGLYQWNEAMQYVTTLGTKGICPTGWHIPTLAELQTLASAVGNNSNALKAIGQGSGSGAGTNSSGFSSLLAGRRNSDTFHYLGSHAHYWSSSLNDSNSANFFMLLGEDNNPYSFSNPHIVGFSVRCIRD